MLTTADIMQALRCGEWTARKWLSTWEAVREADARAGRPSTVPLVTRVSTGGRPGYRADADSFARWLRGAAQATTEAQAA